MAPQLARATPVDAASAGRSTAVVAVAVPVAVASAARASAPSADAEPRAAAHGPAVGAHGGPGASSAEAWLTREQLERMAEEEMLVSSLVHARVAKLVSAFMDHPEEVSAELDLDRPSEALSGVRLVFAWLLSCPLFAATQASDRLRAAVPPIAHILRIRVGHGLLEREELSNSALATLLTLTVQTPLQREHQLRLLEHRVAWDVEAASSSDRPSALARRRFVQLTQALLARAAVRAGPGSEGAAAAAPPPREAARAEPAPRGPPAAAAASAAAAEAAGGAAAAADLPSDVTAEAAARAGAAADETVRGLLRDLGGASCIAELPLALRELVDLLSEISALWVAKRTADARTASRVRLVLDILPTGAVLGALGVGRGDPRRTPRLLHSLLLLRPLFGLGENVLQKVLRVSTELDAKRREFKRALDALPPTAAKRVRAAVEAHASALTTGGEASEDWLDAQMAQLLRQMPALALGDSAGLSPTGARAPRWAPPGAPPALSPRWAHGAPTAAGTAAAASASAARASASPSSPPNPLGSPRRRRSFSVPLLARVRRALELGLHAAGAEQMVALAGSDEVARVLLFVSPVLSEPLFELLHLGDLAALARALLGCTRALLAEVSAAQRRAAAGAKAAARGGGGGAAAAPSPGGAAPPGAEPPADAELLGAVRTHVAAAYEAALGFVRELVQASSTAPPARGARGSEPLRAEELLFSLLRWGLLSAAVGQSTVPAEALTRGVGEGERAQLWARVREHLRECAAEGRRRPLAPADVAVCDGAFGALSDAKVRAALAHARTPILGGGAAAADGNGRGGSAQPEAPRPPPA